MIQLTQFKFNVPPCLFTCRYNDFKHDDLSVCNCTPPYSGENAIAARSDLNPPDGMYPFSALGHRLHGAIDMKVNSLWFNLTMYKEDILARIPVHYYSVLANLD